MSITGLHASVDRLFQPGRLGRIGVEVELIPSFADGSAVPPAVLAAGFDDRQQLRRQIAGSTR